MEDKSQNYKSVTILFADDQKFMLKNLKRYFKQIFEVRTTDSFTEAKKILEQDKIDIIIADHQMADGDGIEILNLVNENYPTIRKIMITADRHEKTAMDAISNGLAHSIAYKPTVKDQLEIVIKEQADILLNNSN